MKTKFVKSMTFIKASVLTGAILIGSNCALISNSMADEKKEAVVNKAEVVAQYAGNKVTRGDILKEINTKPIYLRFKQRFPDKQDELFEKVLTKYVDKKILLKHALKSDKLSEDKVTSSFKDIVKAYRGKEKLTELLTQMGTDYKTFETEAKNDIRLKQYIDNVISKSVSITDTDVNSAIKDKTIDPEAFREVEASHILIKLEKDASKDKVAEATKKINNIAKEANGGKPFEELAKKYSEGPTKDRGGYLGKFTKGRMVKEFEEAAFGLKPNQISKPVRTQFGYHLIKVKGNEIAKEQMKETLTRIKVNKATEDLVKSLRKEYNVKMM